MKKSILILAFVFTSIINFGQLPTIEDSLDLHLSTLRQNHLDSAFNYNAYSDSCAKLFLSSLNRTLDFHPETFYFSFDSLNKYMNIIYSEDSLIKIYSWNHYLGGSWHDLKAIAQLEGYKQYMKSNFHLRTLISSNTVNLVSDGYTYTDCIYYKIQTIQQNENKVYLFIGYGTHGSGHHHKMMRAFKIVNQRLIEIDSLFNGNNSLVINIPRVHKIELEYDSITQEISYSKFEMIDDSGFSQKTADIILKWNGELFIEKSN